MVFRFALVVLIGLTLARAVAGQPEAEFIAGSTANLDNPHDLKLSADGHYLFVSDVGNNRVAILDPETLDLIGAFGADHQSGTHDVDVDDEGRVYVADTHNHRVAIYQLEGTEATMIDELAEGVRAPEGVLVHPNGRIYVGGAGSGNVVAYENGQVARELTGLAQPHDLELAADGDIWLADSGNDRMLLLSADLEIKQELSDAPYNFSGVRYQDVLADGTLIAADKNNHQVKIIAPDGELVLVLGTGHAGEGPGEFTTPEGVEVRGDTLWLSDSGNDRIVKYKLMMP